MFSRHIAKTVKAIEHALFELQDFYSFSIDIDTTQLHRILVKITLPDNSNHTLLNLAGEDLKNNLSYLWNWQITNNKHKTILICLKSIL